MEQLKEALKGDKMGREEKTPKKIIL